MKESVPPPGTAEAGRIVALIEEAVNLHTLPVVALEAERLLRDQRTSAQDIAAAIARDLALAERVLRLANSAYYGFQHRIGNLTQAVVLLGFQTVRNIVLTVSVMDTFRPASDDATDYPAFWAHSVGCALAASELAHRAGLPGADEAYVTGLLHDVGKLLVAQHLPAVAHRLRAQLASASPHDTLAVERAALGLDHSDIGSKLAAAWGLPDSVASAIRDHHAPRSARAAPCLADIVQLADCLLHALGLGAERTTLPIVTEGLSTRLGYDDERLAEWIAGLQQALTGAADFFDLMGASCSSLLRLLPACGQR